MWAPGGFISEVRSLDREYLGGQSLGQTLSPYLPADISTQHLPFWARRGTSLFGAP